MWEGVVMYGPLVMATPDITVWEQAESDLDPDLSDIVLKGHTTDTGTDGNVYTLTLGDKTFYPDYYMTDHSTHYLRLNVLNESKKAGKNRGVDKTYLDQAIRIARSRVEAQDAWNALETKVPAFAPWAPNGYARMLEQLAAAEAYNNTDDWHREYNINTYARRRQWAEKIMDLLGCTYDKNQVGMFLWGKIPADIKNVEDLTEKILHEARVFITPGFIFGSNGERYIRISLCAKEEKIQQALERIEKVVK
jgi:hypothetical protein